MDQATKSIALIAACSLVYSLAYADPAKYRRVPQISPTPVFADSFGVNLPEKASGGSDHKASASAVEEAPRSADSFGLNGVRVSAAAACPHGGKQGSKAARGGHRCIDI